MLTAQCNWRFVDESVKTDEEVNGDIHTVKRKRVRTYMRPSMSSFEDVIHREETHKETLIYRRQSWGLFSWYDLISREDV